MRSMTKYWMMSHVVHVADFPYWVRHATEWNVECNVQHNDVNEGDVIYLANGEIGVYAWGRVIEVGKPANERGFVKISRGAIKQSLIDRNSLLERDELRDLLLFSGGKFNFLLNRQVKTLNSLILPPTPKPPPPTYQQFVINQPLSEDEGLHIEYKEVVIKNIPGEAYEYALAYLSQKGGRVLFGVRDADHAVIGVRVDMKGRDEIKRNVENKLRDIKPKIFPAKDYWMEFHQVIDISGRPVPDCYVFEFEVNESASKNHTTKGGKSYLKSFSGRIKTS